jgi:diketogulonate reductase-like aldo/keto reductase
MKQSSQIQAFETSLELLQLDYIDLYLIHWPVTGKNIESWQLLEELCKSGRVRAIGVSNFMEKHLDALLCNAKIAPAVDQIELHPHFSKQQLVAHCEKLGIACEAWSPLGGTGSKLLEDPVLNKIAKKYSKSPAQVTLRWELQRGIITIPKSIHQERIKTNANVFDFELSATDMKAINDLDKNPQPIGRGWNPADIDF